MSKQEKIAIPCPTKELWDKVQEKAFSEGYSWGVKKYADFWGTYKEETILYIEELGRLTYGTEYSLDGATIIPAEEWLGLVVEPNKDFEVGDEVTLTGYGEYSERPKFYRLCKEVNIGDTGVVVQDDFERKEYTRVSFNGLDPVYINKRNKILTKKGKDMNKEHTVPLREGDKVRVVEKEGYDLPENIKGTIKGWSETYQGSGGFVVDMKVLNYTLTFQPKNLELIPTESDIVVGSVWEDNFEDLRTVVGLDSVGDPITKEIGALTRDTFLYCYKLIHRGDEVVVKFDGVLDYVESSSILWTKEECEECYNNGTGKQTNKKEKKMKRAEKIAKVGMLVRDENCGNQGRIEAIYIEQGVVTYTDLSDNSIHTVGVDRLSISVVLPKVKETKKKGKKKGKK